MAFPSLAVIAQRLDESDIERLLLLKRAGPKLEKLESRRGEISRQLADVEKQIAALTGEGAPKPKARRGRKTGRLAKTSKAPAKTGRKPGRSTKTRPARGSAAKAATRGTPGRKSSASPARLAALAKARAAKAAKRRAAAHGKA